MQKSATEPTSTDFVFIHALDFVDAAITAAMRARPPSPGMAARSPFRIRHCHGSSYRQICNGSEQ
jgi:hypothetical protein